MKIMVETSARHIHLTQEDLDTLFGKDYPVSYTHLGRVSAEKV